MASSGSREKSHELEEVEPDELSNTEGEDKTETQGFETQLELGDDEDKNEGGVVDEVLDNESVLSRLERSDVAGSDGDIVCEESELSGP